MKIDMVMPQMGESITEGTILKWLKKEGDPIQRDETVLEISTDKVDTEIPAPASGVLLKILAREDETVQVGSVIAEIETEAATAAAEPAPIPGPAAVPEEAKKPEPETAAPAKAPGEKRFYSPLVRSIAAKEGISESELARVPATGKNNRVTKKDILAYLEQKKRGEMPAAAPAPAVEPVREMPAAAAVPAPLAPAGTGERVQAVEMDRMRKSIAEHMVRSKQTSPHVYSMSEADVTHLVRYREVVKEAFKRQEGFNLTYTPFFLWALARALRDFPVLNASVEGDRILYKKDINIGMAVALDNGLIVPVIKNADTLTLLGMARAGNDLGQRARSKKLLPQEVQDGTFTLTNLGSFGSLMGTPIISQPQVGILAVGVIKKRVVVVNDAIAIRDMVYLTLGFDHRIIDGAIGGRFLERIVQYLQEMQPDKI